MSATERRVIHALLILMIALGVGALIASYL